MNRKMEKIKRILKDEDMAIVITPNAAFLNGNAIEISAGIQRVLRGIVEDGFPKDLAKSLIEVAFMNDEELDKRYKEELEKTEKNLEEMRKLLKKLEKEEKKNK